MKFSVNQMANEFDEGIPIRWGFLEFDTISRRAYRLTRERLQGPDDPVWMSSFRWTVEIEYTPKGWRSSFGEGETFDSYLPEPSSLVGALDWAFGETFVRNRYAYLLLTDPKESRDEEIPHDEDPVETKLGTFIVREPDQIRIFGESHLKVIDLPGEWTWTLQQTPDLAFVRLFCEEVRVAHFYAGTVTEAVGKALEWIRMKVWQGEDARRLQGFLTRGPEKGETWYDRIS